MSKPPIGAVMFQRAKVDENQQLQDDPPRRGRPPGSKNRKPSWLLLDPLDYILGVIGNPDAKDSRRDRLALAALPYCHAKIGDRRVSKRDQKAKTVARIINGKEGTNGWGTLLKAE